MMRTHDGRINHLQCRVGQAAAGERLQHHIPDATVSPAAELPKNRIPVAELLRQIAPRRAGPHQPKRRVHHTAMVARRTASATDQKRFEIRPLIIGQQSANQGCPPQRAALNQFSIPASIDLSTRPSFDEEWRPIFMHSIDGDGSTWRQRHTLRPDRFPLVR